MSLKVLILHTLNTALLLICGGLIYLMVFNTISVSFTETEAKATMAKALPLTFAATAGLLFKIGEGTTVEFSNTGSVALTGQLVATPMLVDESRYEGTVTLTGTPTFRENTFYLKNVTLGKVTGKMVVSERAKAAGRIAGKIAEKASETETAKATGRFFNTLKDKAAAAADTAMEATGVTPQDIAKVINADKVRANIPQNLEARFEEVPLFTLSGTSWWQILAKDTLQSLKVTKSRISAEIPLSRLYLGILLGIFLLITAVTLRFAFMLKSEPAITATFGRETPAS